MGKYGQFISLCFFAGLLSEIASDYLNNEDDLSGAGRKIELKDNLVVEFNNKASQVNPAFRMLVLAHLL